MLPANTKINTVTRFSRSCCGYVEGYTESFDTLELNQFFKLSIENTKNSDADDYGIYVNFKEGDTVETFIGSEVKKVMLSHDNNWKHTDDEDVIHLTVRTDSGSFKISVFNLKSDELVQTRKVILKSLTLSFETSL